MMSLLDFEGDQPPMQSQSPTFPQSGPLATQPQPQQQSQSQGRPSLMARIGHALAAAGGAVSDHIRPQAPGGYEGMLTPDEIKQARPGLLQSLIGTPDAPSSDDRYRQRLDSMVEHKALGSQMQRQQEILGARKELMTRFPLPTSGNEEDLGKWANQVMPWLMQSGDYEGVKTLQPLVGAFAKKTEKTFEPQLFKGPTGEMKYFSPDEQTAIPQGWTPVTKPGSAGNGTPQLFRGPKGDYVGVAPGDNETLAKLSKQGYKPEVTARTEFVQGNVGERFDTVQGRMRNNRFMTDTKPLRDRAHVIDQAIMTISDAAHNPDPRVRKSLYSSAVANFVQAADQKAQIRYQLLNYFKDNVDPSIAGKWSLLKERLINGSLPQYTMEGMLIHLKNLRHMTAEQFDAQRKGIVERHPEMDEELPSVEEYFPGYGDMQAEKAMGGESKPSSGTDDGAARAAWAKANPPMKGETREQYKARFEKTRSAKR